MGLRDVFVPERTDTAATTRIGIAGRYLPWWVVVLGVYVVSRVVTTTLMLTLFIVATTEHWTFASPRAEPDFFTFSGLLGRVVLQADRDAGLPDVHPDRHRRQRRAERVGVPPAVSR